MLAIAVALPLSALLLVTGLPRSDSQPGVAEAQARGGNPLHGLKLWVDPKSQAYLRYLSLKRTKPAEAKLILKIGQMPQASWYGEWTPNVKSAVASQVSAATAKNSGALMVAYNIPHRDCGSHSAGGVSSAAKYRNWIRKMVKGIGRGRAVVVLEPDALPLLDKCLSPAQQRERLDLLKFAVAAFKTNPGTRVYIDAGHPRWHPAPKMAARLKAAGIAHADGFALNVSNYVETRECVRYGTTLSGLVGGKHFIVDTSRNGNGPAAGNAWCNPSGRALGSRPTTRTGTAAADAFLWIKRPGESDGNCNGGPQAGAWFHRQALELARNAKW